MSDQCQAPHYGQGKTARKIAVAHLALARSQNTGAGISGNYERKKAAFEAAFLYLKRLSSKYRIAMEDMIEQ